MYILFIGSFTNRGNTITKNTPMGRFGDSPELNGLAHYLLCDVASFVIGSIFDVTGGLCSFSGLGYYMSNTIYDR